MLVHWMIILIALQLITAAPAVPTSDSESRLLSNTMATFQLGYLCGLCSAVCNFVIVGESKKVHYSDQFAHHQNKMLS